MAEETRRLKRSVPLWVMLFIGVGTIIGGDYFIVNSFIILGSGPSTFLCYILAGIVMALVALNYGELISAIPKAGGEFNYISRAFGNFPGWFFTWLYMLPMFVVIGVNGIIIGDYTSMIFPALLPIRRIISLIVVVVFGYVVYRGIRFSAIIQTILAATLVVTLLAFTGVGLGHANMANLHPFLTQGNMGFMRTITFAILFYIGFSMVPQIAEEIKASRREMGKIAVYIVMAVGVVLVLTTLAAVISMPQSEIGAIAAKEWGLVAGFEKWIGSVGVNILIIGAGFTGALTTMLGCFLVGSRGIFAISRAGRLPKIFSRIHSKHRTPHYTIAFITLIGLVFCIPELLAWVTVDVLVIVTIHILVVLSLLKLRRSEPGLERPFKVPLYPVVPIITILAEGFLLAVYIPGVPLASWVVTIGAAIIGVLIWFGYWKRKPKSVRDKYDRELAELEPYLKTE